MVGRFGEVYVMDWGLAKVEGHDDTRDLRIQDAPATAQVVTDRAEADHAGRVEQPHGSVADVTQRLEALEGFRIVRQR